MGLSMNVLSTFMQSATDPPADADHPDVARLTFILLATLGSTLLTPPGVTPAFIGGSLATFAVAFSPTQEPVFRRAGLELAAVRLARDLDDVDRSFALGGFAFAGCPAAALGLPPFLKGSLSFTAFAADFAVASVPDDTSVFPSAARFPIIVPAMAPATAPTGPAITPPTMAPAMPPAVCLDTGRLLLGAGEECFFFMVRTHG